MHRLLSLSLLAALLTISLVHIGHVEGQRSAWNIKQNPFPKAKRVSKTLSYRSAKAKGNVTLADPYQWLQNDDDPDTKTFIADQKKLTETFISKCASIKQIEQSVREAFNYDDYSEMIFFDDAKVPFWFYSVVRPNEERKTYYIATPEEMEAARKANFPNPPGKKYLQEAALSPNATATILYFATSLDRTMIAYLVVEADAGSGTWYIRKLDSPLVNPKKIVPGGEGRLPDAIPNGYQDLRWTLDSKGFFYEQFSTPTNDTNSNPRAVVRNHQIGTPYEKDITLVQPDADPNNYWFLDYSADGRWLVV
ncbi:prolyl oligopeptidase [Meira miltonrushii]|uniref:Prolyl oligopeptidase n=1 Tax=Meira miltonrushii TaxID=1280837 RepID=A0A316VMM5_9BASI|nr:prolyl oligopeptidase [Meira miltonrushii]PWN36815.1 prolyl oligopeptidase [Meira miltonrushii]